jgi:sporulation protein YlmC with PRC-barrel domain
VEIEQAQRTPVGSCPTKEDGMADTTFTIGAPATCSDGPCGAVTRVVVDPVARELTHLVIEPEHRSGLGRLVPRDMVEAGKDGVRLNYTLAEFGELPSAEETDFLPGGSGYDAYAAHEAYYWPYFGLEGGADPRLALASAVETRDMLPPGEIGVRRGEPVHASDGEIGKVEGLVIDSAQGHVTHVLLQEGHLWGQKQVAIPINAVGTIDHGITVTLTKHEIEALPQVGVTEHHR